MLALTFVFLPVVLGAAGAAIAPVVIHLILRARPRRVVFPATQFVRKTHQANISKLRLKHLILLAMRMALIVLLGILLARAMIPSRRLVADRPVPTAAVIVLDDSGSMRYRHRGKTRFARAQQFAQKLIASFPPRSRIAVTTTSGRGPVPGFVSDRELASRQVADLRAGYGAEGVVGGLGRAAGLLRGTRLERKEVYLLSDMTRRSWGDGVPVAAPDEVHYTVVHCGGQENLNVAVGLPKLSAPSVPLGKDVRIETELIAGSVGGEMRVVGELDGAPIAPTTVTVPAGGAAPVVLTVRSGREGLLHGKLSLERSDPLEMDNVRYFTVRVGAPVRVLLVRDRATIGKGDDTYRAVAAAVSTERDWIRCEPITNERLDRNSLTGGGAVMLCGVSSLRESQWRALGQFVREGGGLLVMSGPLLSVESYRGSAAREILPVVLKSQQQLPQPMGWDAPDPGHPMLLRLLWRGTGPLSEISCFRRFQVESVATDSTVIARFADGAPAVISRRVGDGRTVLWTCSPDRSFSDLAKRGVFPFLILRTIELLSAGAAGTGEYSWNQSVAVPVPRGFAMGTVTVRKPGEQAAHPVKTRTGRTVTLPADRLGSWVLRFTAERRERAFAFNVNVDPAESDLTPADTEEVQALFPEGRARVTSGLDDLTRRQRLVVRPVDVTSAVLVGLLLLLIAESFFANRFYKRVETCVEGMPHGCGP